MKMSLLLLISKNFELTREEKCLRDQDILTKISECCWQGSNLYLLYPHFTNERTGAQPKLAKNSQSGIGGAKIQTQVKVIPKLIF